MEIKKKPSSVPLVDLMEGADRWEIDVDGQHGIVALIDMMPRLVPAGTLCDDEHPEGIKVYGISYVPRKPTADGAVVQAARTSTGQGLKSEKEDSGLTRYLYRHRHGTPFEMVTFKFYHVLPIFIARQLIRHRMASVNEYSLRYAEVKDRFWIPAVDGLRTQGKSNKQHTEGSVDLKVAEQFVTALELGNRQAMDLYQSAVNDGVGRELARVNMPLSLYTEWYWELDLRNLMQFLSLRQDKHAQKEIRDYADAMYELVKPLVPVSIQAYDDYDPNRGGLLLSALDLRVIRRTHTLDEVFSNTRELSEFRSKLQRMGIEPQLQEQALLLLNRREVEKKVT